MEDSQNQEFIDEMLRSADIAEEPGEMAKNRVVNVGGDDTLPMVATKLTSAGYVYIYDTRTHEPSLTNRNMLPTQLRKVRDDGSYVFTTKKPKEAPFKGNLKCMLHPDNPERAHYDELGLATCRKSNLTAPFHVMRHMQTRHKMEWAIIEKESKDIKDAEDRAYQRAVLEMAAGRVGKPDAEPEPEKEPEKAPLYVSDKEPKPKKKPRKKK